MNSLGDDCHDFYNSIRGCPRGDRCPFRHSEYARSCFVTCRFWKNRRCTKRNCRYRHSDLTFQQKNRHLIPCFHENQPSGCTRPDCQFKHCKPRTYRLSGSTQSISETYALVSPPHVRIYHETASKPGTPVVIDHTANSIKLSWTEPDKDANSVISYIIAYREYIPNREWQFIKTGNTKTSATLTNLNENTDYEFKVGTIGISGNEGPFSCAVRFSTESSLGSSEMTRCYNSKIPLQKNRQTIQHSDITATFSSYTHAMAPLIETGSDFCLPVTPIVINCTSNSIMLSWDEPDEGLESIESYKIAYRECSKNSKWKFVTTRNTKTLYTVSDLKGDTEYELKVCTINMDGEDGPFGLLVKSSTRSSLAFSVKLISTKVPGSHNPEIYKIPLHTNKQTINHVAKIRKCYFGQQKVGVRGKTIMMVDATGSGKSTLINSMINYILGVKWNEEYRLTLVDLTDEEMGRHNDQTQSQTEWVTCYTVRAMDGSNLDYDLHIVDTPSFGDTRGVVRNKVIVDQIRDFFTIKGNKGMFLDAICFVVQAPLARLTPPQKDLFHAILSIFGQDVVNNICVLITFADGNRPPVLDALKAAGVPFRKPYKFNNSAVFTSLQDSHEATFRELFWKMGQESCKIFFDDLRSAQTISLQLTKEVLQTRRNLEATIQGLQPQIHEGMNQLYTIQQEKEILQKHEIDIDENKNFKYEVDEIRMIKVDLDPGKYATNCLVCNRTCHFPCQIAEDRQKMNCAAMQDHYCTVCPQKCFWEQHRKNDFRIETYSVKVKRSYEQLKNKYQTARVEKIRQMSVLDKVQLSFKNLYQNVQKMMRDVRSCINQLQKIALQPNPMSDVDYIDLLIENEKSEKKCGWIERLGFYNRMREEVRKAASNINPFGDL